MPPVGHADGKLAMFFNLALAKHSAVLQQVVEHDIGHFKYDYEGIDDKPHDVPTPTKKDKNHKKHTPNNKSLDGEAGYMLCSEKFASCSFANSGSPRVLGSMSISTPKSSLLVNTTFNCVISWRT